MPLAGAFCIAPERIADRRGFFARAWCQQEFTAHGLNPAVAQCSISFNARRGTVRGMHYQVPPFQEDKLVRCTGGALYDVIVDLRSTSPTFGAHVAQVLTQDDHYSLNVPKGFAHGFMTLEETTQK